MADSLRRLRDRSGLSPQNRSVPGLDQPLPEQTFDSTGFLIYSTRCEFHERGILESLARDPWPCTSDKCSLNYTGVAVSIAVSLLEVGIWSLKCCERVRARRGARSLVLLRGRPKEPLSQRQKRGKERELKRLARRLKSRPRLRRQLRNCYQTCTNSHNA